MVNFVYIAFGFLAFGVPMYNRYEHTQYGVNERIPTQIKWTGQIAVGSGAAVHSVCRIVTWMRGKSPNTVAHSFYCSSLGFAGAAMSAGTMTKNWNDREWQYWDKMTGGWFGGDKMTAGGFQIQTIETEDGELVLEL